MGCRTHRARPICRAVNQECPYPIHARPFEAGLAMAVDKNQTQSVSTAAILGPLSGIRVVDFGQYLAGPGTGMILADQGADVIRVERPGGPSMPGPVNAVLNRGKRGVVLDLKTNDGLAIARDLIAGADGVDGSVSAAGLSVIARFLRIGR